MILLERDIELPAAVESVKAQVLHVLRANHRVQEFDGLADLSDFLDGLLDELVEAGAPRGLTRVLLFHRNPNVLAAVASRLMPGAAFHVFRMPACWMQLGRNLPELIAWAKQAEPAWLEAMPRGI